MKRLPAKRQKLLEVLTPYLFLSPWLLGFAVLTAVPLVFSFVMSFYNWSITGTPHFAGIQNYIDLFTKDAQFYKSVSITFRFAAIFVPLNLLLALFLAVLISQPAFGVKVFRMIFYLPSVVSSVAVAIIWGWILNGEYGILNYLLSFAGIRGPLWLLDPKWAFAAIIFASAWGVGTMMLIFYTDIKTIPADIYEAAELDGVPPIIQFFKITVPIITPSILFNLITSVITALQQLALVLLLTNGGPLRSTYFYGLFVYNNAFRYHKLGYAASASWFMFVIILLLTMMVFRSSSAWVYYESEVQPQKTKPAAKGGGL